MHCFLPPKKTERSPVLPGEALSSDDRSEIDSRRKEAEGGGGRFYKEGGSSQLQGERMKLELKMLSGKEQHKGLHQEKFGLKGQGLGT